LNKAGRLAAKQHLILKDPKIPDATAVKMVKPMAKEQVRLTKRIRMGPTPAVAPPPDEEGDEGMAEGPLENMLRKIIKGTTPKPARPAPAVAGPSGVKIKRTSTTIKKEPKFKVKKASTTIKKEPKPSTSKKGKEPATTGGWKKAAMSGATKAFLKKAGISEKFISDEDDDTDDTDGGYSPKKTTKKPAKAKKTEAEKLGKGWEEWDKPSKRGLDYDTDDSD